MPSQTFDGILRNRVYIAQVDVPDYGISTRGDFEPLVSEKFFIASRRSQMAASRLLHRANEIIQIFRYAASCDLRLAADRERAQAFT